MSARKSILIVDDQPAACEAIKLLLTCDGHAVDTAGSGQEALERARQHTYDLMITDNTMPEMTGEELAHAVKAEHPGLRVVMFSGLPPDRPIPAADLVLRKPHDIPILRETVRNLLSASPAPDAGAPA